MKNYIFLLFYLIPFFSFKTDALQTEADHSVSLVNKTRFSLAVSILYLDEDNDWVTNHYILKKGESSNCCRTNNRRVYYYAVDSHGYGWEIRGSETKAMNYYNTYVGFKSKTASEDESIIRISFTEN